LDAGNNSENEMMSHVQVGSEALMPFKLRGAFSEKLASGDALLRLNA
jgi:hypothetical protein